MNVAKINLLLLAGYMFDNFDVNPLDQQLFLRQLPPSQREPNPIYLIL